MALSRSHARNAQAFAPLRQPGACERSSAIVGEIIELCGSMRSTAKALCDSAVQIEVARSQNLPAEMAQHLALLKVSAGQFNQLTASLTKALEAEAAS